MMLVGLVGENATRHLFVCIPDLDLSLSYYGFARLAKSDLPRAPCLIEGERSAFEEMFQSWA